MNELKRRFSKLLNQKRSFTRHTERGFPSESFQVLQARKRFCTKTSKPSERNKILFKFSRITKGFNIKSSELSTKLEDFVVFVQNLISFTKPRGIQEERFFLRASGKIPFLVQQLAKAKLNSKPIFLESDKVTLQEDKNFMYAH